MKCGLMWDQRKIKYGYGRQLIVIHGIQSALLSEIGAIKRVLNYGNPFLLIIGNVLLFIQITGKVMRIFSLRSVIGQSEKKAVRQRILNVW